MSDEDPTDMADESATGIVTGTLSFRERIMLRPGTVAVVELVDTSGADAASVELAQLRIENLPAPPIPFNLEYARADVDPAGRYAVRATLRRGERLLMTTDTQHPVLTRGAPDAIDVILVAPKGRRRKHRARSARGDEMRSERSLTQRIPGPAKACGRYDRQWKRVR